jgi:hypothetical protein
MKAQIGTVVSQTKKKQKVAGKGPQAKREEQNDPHSLRRKKSCGSLTLDVQPPEL